MSIVKGNLLLLLASVIWGTAFVAQTTGMGFVGPLTFTFAQDLSKATNDETEAFNFRLGTSF